MTATSALSLRPPMNNPGLPDSPAGPFAAGTDEVLVNRDCILAIDL